MLKYIKIILSLFVVVLFTNSCKDSTSPAEQIANAVGVSTDGKVPPVFLRICNWSRLETNAYTGTVELSKSQYLWAYLSDGSDFIDPSAIYFNNQPLRKLEKGQYEFYKHYRGNTEGSNQTTCLTVAGLDGESYNIIGNILHDEVVFRNIDYKDTLDLSKDITIEYDSPRYGNEEVIVDFQYDYYDADGKSHYCRKLFWAKDNHGSVQIPPEILKELPVSAEGKGLPYCTIGITRKISSTENVKSADGNYVLIGKVYEASFDTYIYLKRSN